MSTVDYLKYGLIRTLVNTVVYVRRSYYFSPSTQPDFARTYPCRPHLFPCRVFLPGDHSGKLPLVIHAHGGGCFIVNNPATDDPMARHLAEKAQCVVVSIDYSKSPQNRFPTANEDVIAQTLAVIEDAELPIDRERVVLCGSSAGGNLLLAAAQDSRLRPKIMGVVGVYPPVDWVLDGEAKIATRPDPSIPDFIGDSYAVTLRLYFDPEDEPSLTDTRVSPAYFKERDSILPNVLLIGTEHDTFCHEDEQMAEQFADEGVRIKEGDGWRAPGVQYVKIFVQPHAFDNFPVEDVVKEKARVEAVEKLHGVISDWLVDVFSSIR